MARDRIWPAWEAEAKGMLDRHDLQGVLVVAVGRDGVVSTHSYGEDRRKCRALAKWIENLDRALSVIPFATVFGWGNGGKPKPLPPGTAVPAGWEEFT